MSRLCPAGRSGGLDAPRERVMTPASGEDKMSIPRRHLTVNPE
jgi:hypothetical protein